MHFRGGEEFSRERGNLFALGFDDDIGGFHFFAYTHKDIDALFDVCNGYSLRHGIAYIRAVFNGNGFAFGIAVLLSGDAALFMPVSVFGTILTVLLKGSAAGFLAGFVYKLLEGKNRYMAVMVSALVCPVVNTGIFLLGCRIFFMETISGWAAASGFENAGTYMIVGLVGLNFVVELVINIIMAPAILRIINYGVKGKN